VTAESFVTVSACIACGRVDRLAECTGDCADRRLMLVDAGAHAEVERAAERARAAAEPLRSLVARLDDAPAGEGAAAAHYADLQRTARQALDELHADEPALKPPALAIETWRCLTCGRIEAPQPCLGVCIKHPADMIAADVHAPVRTQAEAAFAELARLTELVRRIAHTTPRAGQAARTLGALRDETRGRPPDPYRSGGRGSPWVRPS
jgi:hypothetical protein